MRPEQVIAAIRFDPLLPDWVLIALAVAWDQLDPGAAWRAAHVDEDWNISQWGEDADAAARRISRESDFKAAALALRGA